ncbi:hypothetical protein CPB84DRAFT_1782293 [Gymnopilus junonius]|uniref:J domain-containing protein n=1 Tax=Gymnopilus junonius TaxID=109634 RepID=A0A9P5NL82_GYMJU|nr:hypothetical protein CPB84DRAFT_1782293 [Gymnopilus junonius]
MSRTLSVNFNVWAISNQCRHRKFPHFIRCINAATTAEYASSNTDRQSNPFPYPTHRNPTPHQLFHLPINATKLEIKARYYDLVRLYHPDKISDSTDPTVALARFRAITAAYDALRGKTPLKEGVFHDGSSDLEARYRTTASYRAMRQKRQELYNSGAVDDSRKDKLILAGLIMTVAFVVIHTSLTRREAMAAMLVESRSFASDRQHRQKPVEDYRLSQDPEPPNNATP